MLCRGPRSITSEFYVFSVLTLTSFLAMASIVMGGPREEFDRLLDDARELFKAAKNDELEALGFRLQRLAEKQLDGDPWDVGLALIVQSNAQVHEERHAEAKTSYERALTLFDNAPSPRNTASVEFLCALAAYYYRAGRYSTAELLFVRAIAVCECAKEKSPLDIEPPLNDLGLVLMRVGRYAEAEALYNRCLRLRESLQGPDSLGFSHNLLNLALVKKAQGCYLEAEALNKRALQIKLAEPEVDELRVAKVLHNMGSVCKETGRYAEAAAFGDRALEIRERILGRAHSLTGDTIGALGNVHLDQERYAEALPFHEEALRISESTRGMQHPLTNIHRGNLALTLKELGRTQKAIRLLEQVLGNGERVYGPDAPVLLDTINNLGNAYSDVGQLSDAERLLQRGVSICEKSFSREHASLARVLHNLALLEVKRNRPAEAKLLFSRAITIRANQTERISDDYSGSLFERAKASWKLGERGAALADLEDALEEADHFIANASGSSVQKAYLSGKYHSLPELMLKWQYELGDISAALTAIEQNSARTLMEQMSHHGLDPLESLPSDVADSPRRREGEAKSKIADLQTQLSRLRLGPQASVKEYTARREQLRIELQEACDAYGAVHTELRNAAAAHRLQLSGARRIVTLHRLQQWLAEQDSLLLEYFLGFDSGYVLIVPPEGPVRLETLEINTAQAELFGVKSGPVSETRLSRMVRTENGEGLLDRFHDDSSGFTTEQTTRELAALWKILVPPPERQAILTGKYKRLVVVPYGTLARLPFETLVVTPDNAPKYLLDAGPPILYAPSATALLDLAEREPQSTNSSPATVLTVGHPRYDRDTLLDRDDPLAGITPRARYHAVCGSLPELPYTRYETNWVAEVRAKRGLQTVKLTRNEATERGVRAHITDASIVHFACHGLVDNSHGNLFGALALTPGDDTDDLANDGFLTMAEIYQLDMKRCELAILSACDTNFGEVVRGEGTWALSRSFLVAGARRVVASNWLVDDKAAASFVSYFCSIIANAEAAGEKPDYAEALWKAKRFIHKQEKWKSPYYWAQFVLVGPN